MTDARTYPNDRRIGSKGRSDGSQSDRTPAGLTPTGDEPAGAIATVDLEGRTVTDAWRTLFDTQAVRDSFIRAIRSFARGRTVPELYSALEDRGVPHWLRSRIRDVARGNRRTAWHLVLEAVPGLGSGQSTVDDILTTARLFDALEETPTLGVIVREDFRNRRRDQRTDLCRLVATLSRAFDVRLVATRVTRAWLAREHREDLPGVSEWCNRATTQGPLSDAVDEALEAIDAGDRSLQILRSLSDEPGETLPYSALYAEAHVGEARVRQCITDLVDLGLVATFGPSGDRKVELLEAGRRVLEAFDERIGRQQRLDEAVIETPKSHTQAVLSRARERGEDGGEPYRTVYRDRPNHAAAAACGTTGDVCLVNQPAIEGEYGENGRVRYVSYDENKDEALVSVRASGALQHTVSIATALASPKLFDRVLPVDRLEAIDEPPAILRNARCIGGLSDEALEDPQVLRDTLVEWGTDLEDLTTDLRRGEYDDRDTLRSKIMRSAHGLAGSIVHLLDAVGADLVREVYVPAALDRDHLEELSRSVAVAAAIQSRYGAFATYRQLYDTPAGSPPFSPNVDATDPTGSLIGGYVLRGPDVHRIRPSLERWLETPAEPTEDAPEFTVDLSVRSADRPEYATAVSRVLSSKNLRPTREAVSLLHGFTASPHAAARALQQLGTEDRAREIRPDELRYALATLEADRILPDLPPTVGKIVTALLGTEDTVSQTELADLAGVSTQSVRNHRDRLEALDMVRVDGTEWRLSLSFPTPSERRDGIVPSVTGSTFLEAVDALLTVALPPERYGDPEDPIGGALFWPPEPWALVDESTVLEPWVYLAARLTGTERPNVDREATVSMGPAINQTPLPRTSSPNRDHPEITRTHAGFNTGE